MASQQITNIVLLPVPLLFPGYPLTTLPWQAGSPGLYSAAHSIGRSTGESLAKWNFNEFKTCWAGQEKELGSGYEGRGKKAENWPLVMETYAGPIASDKQVLGELC